MRGRYSDAVGLAVIREHTLGLAEIGRQVSLDTPVPTCPGWSVADLVWHLTEVQHFWTHIITHRPDGPDSYEEPVRPADTELVDGLERGAPALLDALAGADPSEAAWSWADDHTVGFTLRRQSHEAVVHHVDGRLAAGADLPTIAPRLAADGVDEMIDVMLTGVPDWATFERGQGVITLRTRDTGDDWTLAFGRMTGTSPDSGKTYDLDALELVDEPADAAVAGDAVELHLWLSGRGELTPLAVEGDVALAHRLRAAAALE